MRWFIKKKEIDLNAEVKLSFVKRLDENKYCIYFFNPYKNKWWGLPSGDAGIHKFWSLRHHGCYGAYDLGQLWCGYKNIDSYKKQFKTINDIRLYLRKFGKDYIYWTRKKRHPEKYKKLPNIVKNY